MMASITGVEGARFSKTVITQMSAFGIGFVLMIIILHIDYLAIEKLEKPIYILSFLFQCTVYLPKIGQDIGGNRAWIRLFGMTMQPSDLTKIALVLCLSCFLKRNMKQMVSLVGLFKAFIYAAPLIGIVMKEDFGAGIVMSFMFVGMIFTAGIKGGLFLRLAALFAVCVPIIYRFLQPHQKERFDAFLHPENLSIDATYQVWQSKVAIGSGGLFGRGLFHGKIKESNFLPVQESDFVFSIICEEFGVIGGISVIVIYAVMLTRMWLVVARAKDYYGAFIGVGFLCLIGFQIFENVGMVMGLMPVTGITLPFLSAGGTSIIANMITMSIVLNIGIRNRGLND
jgi:rod shape determining protein RodA